MNNDQSNIIFPVSPFAEGLPFLQEDTFYQPQQEATNYQQGDDFRTSFYNPFEIKHRKRTSRAQFKVLERKFVENPKPNAAIRRWLAQKLSMTPRGVQVWFQNRRAKEKTVSAKKPVTINTPPAVVASPPPIQQQQDFSSPEQSVCFCNDCCFTTPMTQNSSYHPTYSGSSSNGEEDDLLTTPSTPFVDQFYASPQQPSMYNYPTEFMNNTSRKMSAPVPFQDWMFPTTTTIWTLPNETTSMFDQRRYSEPIIQSNDHRRFFEPIFYDQELNFDAQFGF